MNDPAPVQLLWISPSTSKGRSSRSKLRRDVMQKVAIRRKQGPKRSHPNSRQLPVFLTSEGHAKTSLNGEIEQEVSKIRNFVGSEPQGPYGTGHTDEMHLRILPLIYPTMLVKCGLDFSDLSLLSSLEVGRYTGQRLLERPQNMVAFLGGKNWSYCQYMPALYSQSVLIQKAADCVVARVRCLLTPGIPEWESLAITSYSKALSHLQEAINCPQECLSAELLCATQVLGLYEVSIRPTWKVTNNISQLLNPCRADAWVKHAAGAACIIQLRGPKSYTTELEKSLLLGQIGPIVSGKRLVLIGPLADCPTGN